MITLSTDKEIQGIKSISLYVNEGVIYNYPDLSNENEVDVIVLEDAYLTIDQVKQQPKWERIINYSQNYKQNYNDEFAFLLHGIENDVPETIKTLRNNRLGYIAVITTTSNKDYIFPTPIFLNENNTKQVDSHSWAVSLSYRIPSFENKLTLLDISLFVEGIDIPLDMSTPSTAGFNLTFASGNLFMDWDDGGGLIPFVSGVELLKIYTTPGTKNIKISGSLENITAFVADSSKITTVINLKTSLLTALFLNLNLLSGNLDLSLAPISGTLALQSNSGLTSITFATSGNALMTIIGLELCDLTALDFSNVPVSGLLRVYSNPNLATLLFATSGNSKVTDFQGQSCAYSTLDFSNVPIGGSFLAHSNPNLATLIFSTSGNSIVTSFQAHTCVYATLDLSNVPIGGLFLIHLNPNLTSIIFATSGNSKMTAGALRSCNFSTLDFSNVPVGGVLQLNNNPNLASVTFSTTGNSVLTSLDAYSCNLNYVDTTNLALNANNCNWQFQNNLMVVADVNHMLVDFYSLVSGEGVGGDFTGRTILIFGTNAAPDGSSGGFNGTQAVIDLTAKGITVTTS